jgi:hypothetical protein
MSLSVNQMMNDAKLLTYEELRELNTFLVDRIKYERGVKSRSMKRTLFVGSKVSFENNDGKRVEGKVIKIMRKYAKVDVGTAIWRVPIVALAKGAA